MTELPTILITGATKGIGLALVDRFAPMAGEMHLVARNADDLKALQSKLAQNGCKAYVYAADLSQKESVDQLVIDLNQSMNSLHLLISNAGVYLPGQLLTESADNLDYMIRLNVLSHFDLVRGLYQKMPRGSHLVYMASVASKKLFTGKPSYSISKHAQGAMIDAFRHELRPLGIKVTSIMPGPTWSASWEGVDFPKARLLDAQHVANAVWHAWNLPPEAVMEEMVIRPFEGDID
ncbi:MAG: SDR family NAD(P)-dependent oxidoreductase [Bacteroidetes bacterium]|nr:SDR family NAD(P)-dependent oxidoreductase [Bacteroidota bacterium]MDA1336004.1 SDR family NAD(P)-dependent oxidoreductase [Bacteroidota bacterium]